MSPWTRDLRNGAIAFAVCTAIGFPAVSAGTGAARQQFGTHENRLRLAGLALLENERSLQRAIRSMRAGTIVRHRVSLGDRLAVDRAVSRLAEDIAAGPFASDLSGRAGALRGAWSRVPERGRSLGAIDAVLAADEDLANAAVERAAIAESDSAVVSDGLRLYVSLLPAIEDRTDQQRNLLLGAAAAHRVPNGTGIAVAIFASQTHRYYQTAVAAAQRLRASTSGGNANLDALRRVGYAGSRFDAAIRFALAHPKRLAKLNALVRARTSDYERAITSAEASTLGLVRDELANAIRADDGALAHALGLWWTLWEAGAVLIVMSAIAVRANLRRTSKRSKETAELRSKAFADHLAATEAQLDAIFSRATIGVAIFNSAGTLLRANPALETMFERPDAASIGARSDDFGRLVAGTIDGFTTKTSIQRNDGPRYFQTDFSLIRDAEGQSRFVMGLVRDTTVRTNMERRLQFEATHDPLSRLPNRAFLLDRMRSAYFGDVPPNGVCAVAYIDIGCEAVSLGTSRTAGDDAIVAIAQRLAAAVELNTFVARFDGDGFVVLLDGLPDRTAAAAVVERIVARLSGPLEVGEREILPCVNAGIALIDKPYADPLDMVRDAEVAMREARTRGRSAIATFVPDFRDRIVRRTTLGSHLRRAVERDQLYLQFQPVVHAPDRSLRGFETLLRWEHPELGAISPVEFIPVAEETGCIVPIGRWVFDRACAQMAAWRSQGMDVHYLSIAINASVLEIVQADYASYVQRAIARHGLEPHQVVIEVTESAILESGRYATGSLESLKALGVRLAIDDFGTGYSSMRYLLEFPFNELKIDQSFVRAADGTLASEAIVSTLVTLAKSVGMTTVAEGVETEVQAGRLLALGVDELQGYLFSRPIAASAVPELLRRPRLRLVAN